MNTASLKWFLFRSRLRAYALLLRSAYIPAVFAVGLVIYALGVGQHPVMLNRLYRALVVLLPSFLLYTSGAPPLLLSG